MIKWSITGSIAVGISFLLISGGVVAAPSILPPAADEASVLFDKTVLPVFELTVDQRDWNWLQLNAKEKKTIPAFLRVDGQEVGKVGLRYKGTYGTLYPCLGDKGPTCKKLSLKIKFDQYEKGLRFHGVKTLNLNSMLRDSSQLHDRLAFWVFREMGVPAPRTNYARVLVNGEAKGLFLMVEQVDREFIRTRFNSPEGPLYKEAWPQSAEESYYAKRAKDAASDAGEKDGEEKVGAHVDFVAFHRDLVSSDGKNAAERLGRWVDLDAMSRYMAVDLATRNCDGITGFYILGDGKPYGNHNFYWYQDPGSRKFHLIPWDLDWTFQLFTNFNAVPAWNSGDRGCDRRYPTNEGGLTVMTAACDPFFRELAACGLDVYHGYLRAVLKGPLKEGVTEARIDEWASQISEAVRADAFGPGWDGWRQEVTRLKKDLKIIRVIVQAEERGERLAPLELSRQRVNDFERVTEIQTLMGVNAMCNASSNLTLGPNKIEPLHGKRDFRADFTFRDEDKGPSGAWQQWCMMAFNLATSEGATDLTGGWKVRMKVRSNVARGLRVNIDSSRYVEANTMNGVLYGWEAQVGPEPQTLEFALDAATYPGWARVRPDVTLASVLGSMKGISLNPQAVGRTPQGVFPEGVEDPGFLQVDDIEFVKP